MTHLIQLLGLMTLVWLPLSHAQTPAADPALEPATTVAPGPAAGEPGPADWTAYGRNNAATRYSPLDLINRDNVADLKPVWGYRTGNLPEQSV